MFGFSFQVASKSSANRVSCRSIRNYRTETIPILLLTSSRPPHSFIFFDTLKVLIIILKLIVSSINKYFEYRKRFLHLCRTWEYFCFVLVHSKISLEKCFKIPFIKKTLLKTSTKMESRTLMGKRCNG